MKLLRIGVVFLVVGVSLLVATNLRATSIMINVGSFEGVFGPYVLEPRETIIVLKDVDPPQNLTMVVVNAQSWRATLNISEVDPVFIVDGLRELDAVIFKMGVRGLYYIVVTTSTGELTGSTNLALEQRGLAEDLLWISGIVLGIGVVTIVVHWLRSLRRRD